MNIEKKQYFLEKFEEKYKKWKKIERYFAPGLKNKIKRALFSPKFYISYLIWKAGWNSTKHKKIRLFWGKEFKACYNYDTFFIAKAGILTYPPECDLTKFFIKYLKEDDIFYDIGANYGYYTYLALEFCKEVHSFEPLPDVFENLKLNLFKEPKVFLNNVALSDSSGVMDIFLPSGSSTAGSSIVKDFLNIRNYFNNYNTLKIKTITLREYLKTHTSPTVIKIDVEGAEDLVIRGGEEFFRDNSPIISLEVCQKGKGGEISMGAVNRLRNVGYQAYKIRDEGELEKVDGDLSSLVLDYGLDYYNFIFKK